MQTVAQISLLVFGIVIMTGGVCGFLKAKSQKSLAAGLISGALLIAAHFISNCHPKAGLLLGAGTTSVLTIVFALRLAKTKKFMPSGMLLILTVLEELLLLVAVFIKV